MFQFQIGAIANDDFASFDARAEGSRINIVVRFGRIDDDHPRQQALEIQAHMTFGGGLAPTVAGPIQAIGDQLNDRRVDDMDRPLEAMQRSAPPSTYKAGRKAAQVIEHPPKELLGHGSGPDLVGMRKAVAAGSNRATNARQRAGMQAERIANIVETQSVSELSEEHRYHVAPSRVTAGFILRAGGSAQFRDQVIWNIIAKLAKNDEIAGGWFGCVFSFFHTTPCGVAKTFWPAFFSPAVGRL